MNSAKGHGGNGNGKNSGFPPRSLHGVEMGRKGDERGREPEGKSREADLSLLLRSWRGWKGRCTAQVSKSFRIPPQQTTASPPMTNVEGKRWASLTGRVKICESGCQG